MRCEECGRERPLTYRSQQLGKRSVCADCIRLNYPQNDLFGRTVPWRKADLVCADSAQIVYTKDTDEH